MGFEYNDGVRERVPLLLGVAGYTGSGKTFSSLRIASGIQSVVGGDIAIVDTESKRALQYSDRFKFKHIPFGEPFSSIRYLEALKFAKSKGATVVVVDSATHEHSSVGGYLDMHEKFLDKNAGQDEAKRLRITKQSWIEPSRQRKLLNDWVVHSGMNIIFCYRAKEGMDQKFNSTGWQPETTSGLIWEMTARFLLTPGSDGRPTFNPELALEKMLTKNPEFFRGWFKQGQQLDESLGRKLAEWANNGVARPVGGSFVQTTQDGASVIQESLNADNVAGLPTADISEHLAVYDSSESHGPPADEPQEALSDDADYAQAAQSGVAQESYTAPVSESPAGPLIAEGEVTAMYPAKGKGPLNIIIGGAKISVWPKKFEKECAWFEKSWKRGGGKKFLCNYTQEQNGQYVNNTLVSIQSI